VPFVGSIRLAALSAQQVQALYADRLAAGLSTSTVHHLHATLHKALKDAERLRQVARNVSTLVNVPRMAESEIHPLTREEARRFLDVALGDRLFALYALALASGMRQSEILGLQWPELDLDGALVQVRWQLKHEEGQWVWKPPKTRRSRRQIALAPTIVAALRAHQTAQAEERRRIGSPGEDHELVFCTRRGRPLASRNIYRAFHGLLEKAGIRRVRFHDLRHTAATLLLASRVNPKVVSEMLGHATVAITLDIYSHVLPDMQQDAAATLERVLYG
jgi:integrase